jgi:hypothetical protein
LPIVRIAHPFGNRNRDEIRAMAAQCVDQLLALARSAELPGKPGKRSPASAAAPASQRSARHEVSADLEAIQALIRERRWGDGLPVMPPTVEAVERMLAHNGYSPDAVVASIAPGYGVATAENIAANAVMAGCAPEHLPLVVAAVQALAQAQFNLQGIQATTNSVAVWVVVNGPGAQHLGINAGINCLGQGAWANATLGRAVHLVLQNVGGALPGEMDRATHGQPGKYTFCCAENEAASPWPALHVERGFRPDATTVTVVGAEGTMNMNSHAKDADQLLEAFAQTMIHPPSNEYTHGGEPWLILGPEHAEVLHRAGMSKADVKRELWLRSRMAAGRMTDRDRARVLDSRKDEFPRIDLDTLLTIAPQPEDIQLIVAGGPGTHSVYVPCFGNSRAVTVEVERR